MMRRLLALATGAMLIMGVGAADATAHPRHLRPIVFVHGFAGSGLQFETQAKRLASNGYPASFVEAHEYDSTFATETTDQVFARLDARIARLLAATGADKVDLVAHSLGTMLSQNYLASPERAAHVAHYVNLDGWTAAAPPGGVPTLAIWGEGDPARAVAGASNVYFSDQSHTQVVTSPETFVQVYRFLTGHRPKTTRIIPQPPGQVRVSGRAVIFPNNVGVTDARLEIYEVRDATGARKHHRPDAVYTLDGDGSWGPFRAKPFARYEFAIVREGAGTHHLYFPPFLRTDRLVSLLTGVPGQGLDALTEKSDQHVNLIVSRYKEWWGGSDVLRINGVNVLNEATSPRSKRVIGVFAYDRNVDRVTDLSAPIPALFAQPFITGVDVYIPAQGTVLVTALSRTGGRPQRMNVPAWPSTTDRITIQFNDFP
jgi:hypothetical protein